MLALVPVRHHEFVNAKLEAVERGEITRLGRHETFVALTSIGGEDLSVW